MVRWSLLLMVAALMSACAMPEYTQHGMVLACDKIVDWSERKVCLQKVERYEEDWRRTQSQKQ